MLIKPKATSARFMSDIGRCADISLLGWVRNLIGIYEARELVGFDVIGDRIADKSSQPDERTVRDWMGPEAFEHWVELRSWIDASYPGGFAPDWLYGGKKRGWSLRYKKTKAFCTLLPGYRLLSVLVVLGRAEREKFEARRYSWGPQLVKLYDEARAYPDGKWLTVPISSADDRHEVTELMSMKRPTLSSGGMSQES